MSRKIIKQLKTLQRITPRSEWQAACKEVLLSQVASQGMGTSRPGTFAGIVVYTRTVLSGAYQYTLGAVVAHPSTSKPAREIAQPAVAAEVLGRRPFFDDAGLRRRYRPVGAHLDGADAHFHLSLHRWRPA